MSSINVNTIKSRLGGPPTLPSGVVVSAAATFSTDVSIGGTLTYEDVTNVDAVGLITARNGIKFGVAGVGGTIRANGDTTLAGVVTASQFVGDGSGLTNLVGTGVTNNVNTVNLNVISGISTFGGDVSIADKIIHTGDTNTALRFPAADTITLETGGTERARVTSDGEFLVGTTTDNGFKFKVSDGGASEFAFSPNDSGVNSLVNYDRVGAAYTNFKLTAREQQFWSGASPSERLRITSAGQVGINTTNPGANLGIAVDNSSTNTLATGGEAFVLKNTNTTDNSWVSMDFNNSVSGIVGRFGAQFKDTSDKDTDLYFATRADGGSLTEKLRITSTGVVEVAGITSTASLTVGPGLIQEEFDSYASALTGTYNHDVVDHGMILYAYSNASASFVLNLRGDGSTTLNSLMHIGQSSVFTAYTGSNNASYYMTDFQIDGASQTEEWNGASAPTAGTGSGYDVYTFNILKTADATFKVCHII